MRIIGSFIVTISYKIVSLTYDQIYLRLLMLNNGKIKNIYDGY